MISVRNHLLRTLLQFLFWVSSKLINASNLLRRLRKNSLAVSNEKIQSFEDQEQRLQEVHFRMQEPKSWALTSGTRRAPKKIPYDGQRTKKIQKEFLKAMITLTAHHSGKKTFFVFSGLGVDQSLTAGLVNEVSEPTLIELLQAPYRYLLTAQGKRLRALTNDLTARFVLLIVTQPRFLYATNPSTLVHFFNELGTEWLQVRKGIKKILSSPVELQALLQLADGDALSRLSASILRNHAPIRELLAECKGAITWDGGYVGVFLEQLEKLCPHVELIPMFSMSTESIETLPHRVKDVIYFLPVVPGTLIEFQDPETGYLVEKKDLKIFSDYTLIISNEYGLRRYDTQDIFTVRAMVDGHPDLHFKKRRGMTSSLTGEKITEEHVLELSKLIKSHFPALADAFFSMYPREAEGNFFYELAIIGSDPGDLSVVSAFAEKSFCDINPEYASKVSSGRLKPLHCVSLTPAGLAKLMGREDHWESQFKLLPLYENVIR